MSEKPIFRKQLRALLLALSLLVTLTVGAAAQERRVALVIGNADYDFVANLNNPANDAEDVAGALRRIGFDVTALLNLNYREMRLAIRNFADRAQGADMVFVYFAGHGIEVDNVNYLIPVNAELRRDRDVDLEAIRLDTVTSAIADAPGLKIVIVDACRNNPFLSDLIRTNATRSIGRGLGRIDPGGVLVGYSARGGTLALDGDGRNSPYAEALLMHIEKPGLELGKMFRRVRDTVFDLTNGYQEPFTYGSLPGRDIFLVPGLDAGVSAGRDADGDPMFVARLAAAFAATDTQGTVAAWDAFLSEFGHASEQALVTLAARRREELIERLDADGAGRGTPIDQRALAIQDDFVAYAAAEKLSNPRAWALFFDRSPDGPLKRSAILQEEEALLEDIRDRVVGRYRAGPPDTRITPQMRRVAMETLALDRDDIRNLQTALQERGNNVGGVDGRIGPLTVRALENVQKAISLPVTGIPTRATLDALGQIETGRSGASLFPTSGALARTVEAEVALVLEQDPRLARLLSVFNDRPLIYGYFEGRLYAAIYLGTTFSEDQIADVMDEAGAWLVEIDSAAEQDFVFDLVRFDRKLWTFGAKGFRESYGPTIGLSREGGKWLWRSGAALSYRNWAPGQPASAGDGVAYGRLVPVGGFAPDAQILTRAGWAASDQPSHTIIVEIP